MALPDSTDLDALLYYAIRAYHVGEAWNSLMEAPEDDDVIEKLQESCVDAIDDARDAAIAIFQRFATANGVEDPCPIEAHEAFDEIVGSVGEWNRAGYLGAAPVTIPWKNDPKRYVHNTLTEYVAVLTKTVEVTVSVPQCGTKTVKFLNGREVT